MNAYVLWPHGRPDQGPRPADAYRFRSAGGLCDWPVHEGARLGPCGTWNFLWRLGVHARDCSVRELPAPKGSALWATLNGDESADDRGRLREWIEQGGYVVAAGDPAAWNEVFRWGTSVPAWTRPEYPYAGLAYVLPGRAPELVAPARWRFASFAEPPAGVQLSGALAAVQGERQTPSRATLVPLAGAPALLFGSGYCYVNGNPFAAFQAWLQGQEDLQTWMGWRHRLFWLDEWAGAVADLLSGTPALGADLPRPGIPGLGSTTVVLRHDVDHSRDLSYLEHENARGVAATYAVLRDANTSFWVGQLARHPSHECAFHYSTGVRDWWSLARTRLAGRRGSTYKPARAVIANRGLLRQVQWAQRHAIGTSTLHRHLAFLVYPEWVDAMSTVLDAESSVLGSSSLFRSQVLRWGTDRIDGGHGTIGDWPDAQFPLWLPFKLAHAGRGGRRLPGWESASLMEAEPQLVDQMLRHRVPHLPQRVVTLGYHPAHAAENTFARGGSRPGFLSVLDVIRDSGADVRPLRAVYHAAAGALGVRS